MPAQRGPRARQGARSPARLAPADTPFRRLPGHIDDDRLSGGTDIAASLATGTLVLQRGLLAEVAGGVLIVPMAERLRIDIAGRVAQAMDDESCFLLILLDDGADGDDRPPPALMERIAFDLSLAAVRPADLATPLPERTATGPDSTLDSEALSALAATATALGVASLRPLLQSAAAARAHAALAGRDSAEMADLEVATRLVLAPRATQLPPEAQDPPPPPPEPEQPEPESDRSDSDEDDTPPDIPEDLLIEAARAMIPPDVLDLISKGRAPAVGARWRARPPHRLGHARQAARCAARHARWRRAHGIGRYLARGDPMAAPAPPRTCARRHGAHPLPPR